MLVYLYKITLEQTNIFSFNLSGGKYFISPAKFIFCDDSKEMCPLLSDELTLKMTRSTMKYYSLCEAPSNSNII